MQTGEDMFPSFTGKIDMFKITSAILAWKCGGGSRKKHLNF